MRVAKCQGILSFWRGNLANVRPSAFTDIFLELLNMGFPTLALGVSQVVFVGSLHSSLLCALLHHL